MSYNFKQARQERNNVFNEWKEIKWLSDDIRNIFNSGMKSNNINILSNIGFYLF